MPPRPATIASLRSSASRRGVVDAEGGDRVEAEAGVSDQRPARPVWLAEEVGEVGAAVDAFGPPAGADALAEVAGQVERGEQVSLDIAAEGVELLGGPGDVGHGEAVVGRPGPDQPAAAAVDLAAVERHALPVRVVAERERPLLLVGGRLEGLGDERVLAVGADNHSCLLDRLSAGRRAAADAGDAAVGEGELVDDEALSHLRARVARSLDQQRVEQRPPRPIHRVNFAQRGEAAFEDDRAGIEAHPPDRRRSRRGDLAEQSPALEPSSLRPRLAGPL